MKRIKHESRLNWQKIIENLGVDFHSNGENKPYWNEGAYYEFSLAEIEKIEVATNKVQELCLELVDDIISNNRYSELGLDSRAADLIRNSWNNDERQIYGRFDFSYKNGELKVLEYNADTPTSLFEASVLQWQWLQDTFADKDQFNSIHERLIQAWKDLGINNVHFACIKDSQEDLITTAYLQDTAFQGGLVTKFIYVEDIGKKEGLTFDNGFYDLEENKIAACFKLYPWEWLMQDKFSDNIPKSGIRFIEPAWKMILSNKAMLALLWQKFPNCEYLLPTSFKVFDGTLIRKPYLSREGANISKGSYNAKLDSFVSSEETPGDYGGNYIYQLYHETDQFDDGDKKVTPILGSWVINGESAGMGIREDYGVTTNMASFVPHVIV